MKKVTKAVKKPAKKVPLVEPEKAGKIQSGRITISVTSRLSLIESSIEDKVIEVGVFETAHVTASRGYEWVIKDHKGYPAAKASVFIAWPCYREEFNDVMGAIDLRAKKELGDSVKQFMNKVKAEDDRRGN